MRRLEFKDILIQEKVRPHDPRTLKVKSEDRFDEGQRKVVVGEGHQRLIERLQTENSLATRRALASSVVVKETGTLAENRVTACNQQKMRWEDRGGVSDGRDG